VTDAGQTVQGGPRQAKASRPARRVQRGVHRGQEAWKE
jgi:hypothetical protein